MKRTILIAITDVYKRQGPSGSGKSFHMNSVVRQLHEQGTDVVMVDTGNSYAVSYTHLDVYKRQI